MTEYEETIYGKTKYNHIVRFKINNPAYVEVLVKNTKGRLWRKSKTKFVRDGYLHYVWIGAECRTQLDLYQKVKSISSSKEPIQQKVESDKTYNSSSDEPIICLGILFSILNTL
jgi:hypothetical protein